MLPPTIRTPLPITAWWVRCGRKSSFRGRSSLGRGIQARRSSRHVRRFTSPTSRFRRVRRVRRSEVAWARQRDRAHECSSRSPIQGRAGPAARCPSVSALSRATRARALYTRSPRTHTSRSPVVGSSRGGPRPYSPVRSLRWLEVAWRASGRRPCRSPRPGRRPPGSGCPGRRARRSCRRSRP